jgi:hypothetical protein
VRRLGGLGEAGAGEQKRRDEEPSAVEREREEQGGRHERDRSGPEHDTRPGAVEPVATGVRSHRRERDVPGVDQHRRRSRRSRRAIAVVEQRCPAQDEQRRRPVPELERRDRNEPAQQSRRAQAAQVETRARRPASAAGGVSAQRLETALSCAPGVAPMAGARSA